MEYPEEFVKKVKAEYPRLVGLHEGLNDGKFFVGYYLKNNCHFEMKPTNIVAAFDEGREHEVREAAEKAVRREQLYHEWDKFRQET